MKNNSIILLTLAAISSIVQGASDKCYALALSSGNSMGAYQAGVISQLLSSNPSDEVAYQAVSGVTEGALNAMILA
jgi:predicted acylesterase/phospholipase RssA